MAKWNAKIKKKLGDFSRLVEEGMYMDANMFDQFASWLQDQQFKDSEGDENESGFLSPDNEWLVSFRRTSQDFVYVKLTESQN